jgi:hypothetical protein
LTGISVKIKEEKKVTKSRVIKVVAITVVIAGILWATWIFDSSSAQENSKQEEGVEFAYKLPKEADRAHSDVLIYCNEDAMKEPTAEFAKWKGLQGIPFTLPGGPLAIARLNDVTVSEYFKPAQRTAVEVLKRYSPERIVLVTHTMCLYYDSIAAWNNSLPQMRERQTKDMEASLQLLREWFPKAEILTYLAEEENKTLFFRPLRKNSP